MTSQRSVDVVARSRENKPLALVAFLGTLTAIPIQGSIGTRETGGYRNINVQLCLPELDSTPFVGFVFELQIILESYLALKTAAGHQRYIKCRNIRGD